MPRGDGPVDLGLFDWRRLRAAALAFDRHHQFITAGHLAFVGLVTLFPFLIVLVAIAGTIGSTETAGEALDTALEQVPDAVATALRPVAYEVVNAPRGGALTLSAATALWAASSSVEALRHGFNRAYGVGAVRQAYLGRLQSLALTLLLAVVVVLATIGVVVVPIAVRLAADIFDASALRDSASALASRGLGLALLVATLAAAYKVLPQPRIGWREAGPGAVLAVALWFALAWGFGFYLREFASLSVTYGSLGGVVAALLFFYFTACVVLFGCEFNAVARRGAHARP